MQNLIYYFNLINYALHKYLGVIFLERVADGILYICPKLEDFQKLNQPLPPVTAAAGRKGIAQAVAFVRL